MAVQHLKYHEITEKIIGSAMKVHRYFGLGFPEIVYKRALIIELSKLELKVKQEMEKDIIYDDQLIYKRRLDLIIEDVILVELKAIKEVGDEDFNQILNYLKVFKMEVGLLINFGASSLQFKRLINTIK
jgi:GxxExxY protein